MTDTPKVNKQVTDSLTLVDIKVIGESQAQALSSLSQIAIHANGMALHNAINCQHNLNTLNPAIVTRAIKILK